MKASVSMMTYDHEAFVGQAIESVLEQDLAEDFELVIGEDGSSDRTAEIIRDYERKHPDRIRVLPDVGNQGVRRNSMRTLSACRGQYIAQLDGDDYLTSPAKLRRQVELLDAHSDLALCFHRAINVFPEEEDREPSELRPPEEKERYDLQDLVRANLAASCAVMFRRGLFGDFPEWWPEVRVGDWPLHVMNARHGDIGYIPEVMAARRVHSGGIWNSQGMARRARTNLETREVIRRLVGPECETALRTGEFKDRFRLARELEKLGELTEAREQLTWCRANLVVRGPISRSRFWRTYLRVMARAAIRG